ncbi:AbrB/MazE/SpoVT family DNA-binding domain-containing protein [Granulicella tundricola]|uniref:AbrB/MazE/SpoVT family DNA-binding domain-containing protein n=1 Tax=Granulicella tundricola TaxID=940615 RepID=UPI0018DDEDF8|nr:hypothetical protein [Granulicella tundricola]
MPEALERELHLHDGSTVEVGVESGRVVLSGSKAPKYTMQELLDQCDGEMVRSEEDEAWLNVASVGREI